MHKKAKNKNGDDAAKKCNRKCKSNDNNHIIPMLACIV